MYAGVQWLALYYLVSSVLALRVVVLWNFIRSNVWVFME